MTGRLLLVALVLVVVPAAQAQVPQDGAVTPAPMPTAAQEKAVLPLAGRTVVIDPGHNGGNASNHQFTRRQVWVGTHWKDCDTDGASTVDGYTEAQHNWDVALLVRSLLREQGARVVLTRSSNDGIGPCITRRAAIGNRVRADAAVSIHADGHENGTYRGFHVILPGDTGQSSLMLRRSRALGIAIRNALRQQGPTRESNYVGDSGLIVRSDLGGLNLSTVPKVFTEIGNMHAPEDALAMTTESGRHSEANAIAAGITRFLTNRRA